MSGLHNPDADNDFKYSYISAASSIPARAFNQILSSSWLGTVGSLLIAFGGLGAGALPVVGNPYDNVVLGPAMSRMLYASSAIVFIGIGLLVFAWFRLSRRAGMSWPWKRVNDLAPSRPELSLAHIWKIWAAWILPLIPTAPLFTQDIYSYIANGAIVRQGMNPYSAGPVQLLGTDHPLARSVPFLWANSPSPYGPVSLGIARIISGPTHDSIALAVIGHRLVSITGVIIAGWAIACIARRCRLNPVTALWLGILNPLAILHLIGGIHNEAIMLGLALAGLECGLRGIDRIGGRKRLSCLTLIVLGAALISCAGMVKVTGFVGLGFLGMSLARVLMLRTGLPQWKCLTIAAGVQGFTLLATTFLVTIISNIGLGWLSAQGGAASIRSWLSIPTDIGVAAGFLGRFLGLGDHTDSMMTVARFAGIALALVFMTRMLIATFNGTIHPVGGLGVSTLVLIMFFPVVHPWYILWAVFPLSAWANRHLFRLAVIAYSAPMSFAVLPRGLGLPPAAVASIYAAAVAGFVLTILAWRGLSRLNTPQVA